MTAELLERKARQATADVIQCIKKITNALETRERELLQRIEEARLLKFSAIKARDDGLRVGIVQLTKTMKKLSTAVETYTMGNNPRELIISKDMATSEVLKNNLENNKYI